MSSIFSLTFLKASSFFSDTLFLIASFLSSKDYLASSLSLSVLPSNSILGLLVFLPVSSFAFPNNFLKIPIKNTSYLLLYYKLTYFSKLYFVSKAKAAFLLITNIFVISSLIFLFEMFFSNSL